ncbi:hypothetical protein JN01_0701 [Entomoplasma freundtii]|uniref:Uncharacterized protein n=1 Tax=Entomoplasma freundtii TaxID=74700 RepID=A0A2K8NRK7_9MOLU|nr:hypothetical protein [Entomoplasma freundtii]ATZ16485.1 hypothetical protein EFREU_v1c04590 [Entomoplasma freundtii]TDY56014.1 hypothetical protein JN01_0701 [Entomoplasma freundtii]
MNNANSSKLKYGHFSNKIVAKENLKEPESWISLASLFNNARDINNRWKKDGWSWALPISSSFSVSGLIYCTNATGIAQINLVTNKFIMRDLLTVAATGVEMTGALLLIHSINGNQIESKMYYVDIYLEKHYIAIATIPVSSGCGLIGYAGVATLSYMYQE